MAGYGRKQAAKDTRSNKNEVKEAWHFARDDSGRDKGRYGSNDLRDKGYRDSAKAEISSSLRDAGFTDVQSLPSGHQSGPDKGKW